MSGSHCALKYDAVCLRYQGASTEDNLPAPSALIIFDVVLVALATEMVRNQLLSRREGKCWTARFKDGEFTLGPGVNCRGVSNEVGYDKARM